MGQPLIAVDVSVVVHAQPDDPQGVAAIDAIKAPADRLVAGLRRFAVIGPRVGLGWPAVPIKPGRLGQRDTVFRAIDRVSPDRT